MIPETVYIVTSGSYSDYRINRVYLDRDEAYAYVEAQQKTRYSEINDVEEYRVGPPMQDFDGPIWEGTFRQRRVPATFTLTFPPSATAQKIEDSWEYHEIWHTGEMPPKAEVHYTSLEAYQDTIAACVRGSSKDHVEKSLKDTVARLKAEKAGIA